MANMRFRPSFGHSLRELQRQRIYASVLGCEDLNDHRELYRDMAKENDGGGVAALDRRHRIRLALPGSARRRAATPATFASSCAAPIRTCGHCACALTN